MVDYSQKDNCKLSPTFDAQFKVESPAKVTSNDTAESDDSDDDASEQQTL